ncbi:MAG: ATP-binding cassette domain-containing protein [Chitinophagaceae bacterium]|nr:ATP-binding cassette domain-containing protein [Chitinophagaceae bacterium]
MAQDYQPTILYIQQLQVEREGRTVLQDLSFSLKAGEHLAVLGPSGSGKSTLAMAILSKLHYRGSIHLSAAARPIAFVGQIHQFRNKSNTSDLYYQQRYQSFDADDALTAGEWIGATPEQIAQVMPGIGPLLNKPLVQLSNGEHKKVQLARALSAHPRLLILDQPFIGLDTASRQWLHQKLKALAAAGITLLLITSPTEIPACITHVLQLHTDASHQFVTKAGWHAGAAEQALHPLDDQHFQQMLQQLIKPSAFPFEDAFRLDNVSVAYGDKPVLQQVSWTVKRGERWLLHGPNGAGKSTLLSLITADHPQTYSNKVYLFDKRRGSGESIWDIKKRIGFVSPELQMYFQQTATCYHTVASGLFDTIGLFRTLHPNDEERVQQWLQLFGLVKDQHKPFRSFSAGEQRLILLVRALIKNPPLLVLDEPCQGLDEQQTQTLLRWIDAICLAGEKTLVFVTHYQHEKPACIDKTLSIYAGRVVGG